MHESKHSPLYVHITEQRCCKINYGKAVCRTPSSSALCHWSVISVFVFFNLHLVNSLNSGAGEDDNSSVSQEPLISVSLWGTSEYSVTAQSISHFCSPIASFVLLFNERIDVKFISPLPSVKEIEILAQTRKPVLIHAKANDRHMVDRDLHTCVYNCINRILYQDEGGGEQQKGLFI